MTSRIHSITFDCSDPKRLALFWSAVLAYPTARLEDDLASIEALNGSGARLLFLQVPEGKSVKNRVHLDLQTDDMEAEVDRLIKLGANKIRVLDFGGGDRFTVMQDPEGNEFCVEPGLARVEAAPTSGGDG